MTSQGLHLWIRRFTTLALVALAAGGYGCGNVHKNAESDTELTSTATVANVNGQTTKQPTSAAEIAEMNAVQAKLAAIDAKYPPPKFDPKGRLYRVIGVQPNGDIVIDSGAVLRMDGVECSPGGVANINRVLSDDSARVAFEATGGNATPIPAQVWIVDVASQSSPQYSLIAETALTSGWCEPKALAAAQHPRYVALSALAHEGQK